MRRALHALLVLLSMVPIVAAWALLALGLVGMVWADKLWPTADRGNCWSYAGPRWWRHGGYLGMRSADGVRLAGFGLVPHVMWVMSLGTDARIEQTMPVNRYSGRWLLWRKLYFRFTVADNDHKHEGH